MPCPLAPGLAALHPGEGEGTCPPLPTAPAGISTCKGLAGLGFAVGRRKKEAAGEEGVSPGH